MSQKSLPGEKKTAPGVSSGWLLLEEGIGDLDVFYMTNQTFYYKIFEILQMGELVDISVCLWT